MKIAPFIFSQASDADGPTQGAGRVTYSVTSSNADGVLTVDAASGEVRMARPVSASHTPRGQYELTVRATDQGRPKQLHADAHLTVRVGVPGNQRPVFKGLSLANGHGLANASLYQYHATVPEDAPAHTEVLQVTASDPDGQDSLITYSIAAGSGAKDNFNIDSRCYSNQRKLTIGYSSERKQEICKSSHKLPSSRDFLLPLALGTFVGVPSPYW